jgi:hypothetical protein
MRHTTVFSTLLLIAVMSPASAAMFKWTDANGNVQYGEHPPAGTGAEHIKAAPAPASTPATPTLQQQVDALDKRLATEAEQNTETEQKEQNAENRKINCENAKHNLRELGMGGSRLTRMPDGSYERLGKEGREAQISKNQKAVEAFCD